MEKKKKNKINKIVVRAGYREAHLSSNLLIKHQSVVITASLHIGKSMDFDFCSCKVLLALS